MVPLIGYADRLSVRPGETIEFKISSQAEEPYEARLVRLVSADPNPEGPGLIEHPVEADFAGSYPSRKQPIPAGSHGRVEAGSHLASLAGFTLEATIWPTTPAKGIQGILSCLDPETGLGLALAIGADGAATAIVAGDALVGTGEVLRARTWYRVWLTVEDGDLRVGQEPLDKTFLSEATAQAQLERTLALPNDATLLIGALGENDGHFNGKIEAPAIFDAPAGQLVAGWDFAQEISTTRILDRGPHGLHGSLINLPARGMTGANWSGRETCWRHAPEEYGAIHFHDDDVADFGWETDFSFTVPEDLRSGAYAVRLKCGAHEDNVPFFIVPPKGKPQSELCVLIPTFTYVIYGNHARLEFGEDWRQRAADWNAYPWNPGDHPEYGLSTYNYHSDGSGICHATHRRPLMTLRSGYFSLVDKRGSGLRHFQADSHLLTWLEQEGIDYDLVTDRELHEDGVAAIAGYRALLTSSHPEYHTKESLDALQAYRDGGGRLAYLGGNGFYWRVACHQEDPAAIEIRRGEGGIRAWAAEPGEYFNAFDGAYGGLWRRSGRPPQRLAGVGFSGQGLFEGSPYRRLPASNDPRAAWVFAGIEEEILGDFGLSGGGAAGYELDRADQRLGTPDHALILARSGGHQSHFVLVPEEHLSHTATWPGEPFEDLIRAEIVFFEAPRGGAVFSVGSITFCGSLLHQGGDNNVSRMLRNVVARFLDPELEFETPGNSNHG